MCRSSACTVPNLWLHRLVDESFALNVHEHLVVSLPGPRATPALRVKKLVIDGADRHAAYLLGMLQVAGTAFGSLGPLTRAVYLVQPLELGGPLVMINCPVNDLCKCTHSITVIS